jgi:hypothetical protein
MTLYAIARATVVARATNLLVKTWATVMPGYQVMARLPNDELVIYSRSRATKSQYISIKCTTTEIY